MLKIGMKQALGLKLSPQQIQLAKLLQVTTAELENRIKDEIEENPALEEFEKGAAAQSWDDADENPYSDKKTDKKDDNGQLEGSSEINEISLENYLSDEKEYNIKTRQERDPEDDSYEAPIIQRASLLDLLSQQVGMLDLTPEQEVIANQLIGNIDEDGYLRRSIQAIADDLEFRQGVKTNLKEVETVLEKIQQLDPPGIGAQNLQQCLLLQLKRKSQATEIKLAYRILENYFEEFSKKHFSQICKALHISTDEFKEALAIITRLNPKPGESQTEVKSHYIIPDFIIKVENDEVKFELNGKNAPELRINKNYLRMLKELEAAGKDKRNRVDKETLQFVKSKIESARWFIDALKQRNITLLRTMGCIVEKQKFFFLSEGDETKLKPMILDDVAKEINMDISTISRVANSKYVQTDWGIYQIKYFFSHDPRKDKTEEDESDENVNPITDKAIKKALRDIVTTEDKSTPFSDDKITLMLNEMGYDVKRCTVAKYREQLNIPVARLRKEL